MGLESADGMIEPGARHAESGQAGDGADEAHRRSEAHERALRDALLATRAEVVAIRGMVALPPPEDPAEEPVAKKRRLEQAHEAGPPSREPYVSPQPTRVGDCRGDARRGSVERSVSLGGASAHGEPRAHEEAAAAGSGGADGVADAPRKERRKAEEEADGSGMSARHVGLAAFKVQPASYALEEGMQRADEAGVEETGVEVEAASGGVVDDTQPSLPVEHEEEEEVEGSFFWTTSDGTQHWWSGQRTADMHYERRASVEPERGRLHRIAKFVAQHGLDGELRTLPTPSDPRIAGMLAKQGFCGPTSVAPPVAAARVTGFAAAENAPHGRERATQHHARLGKFVAMVVSRAADFSTAQLQQAAASIAEIELADPDPLEHVVSEIHERGAPSGWLLDQKVHCWLGRGAAI